VALEDVVDLLLDRPAPRVRLGVEQFLPEQRLPRVVLTCLLERRLLAPLGPRAIARTLDVGTRLVRQDTERVVVPVPEELGPAVLDHPSVGLLKGFVEERAG